MILSLAALASAGIIPSHGYGGEEYAQEAVAYAPVAQLSHYGGHEDQHVDYHVRLISNFHTSNYTQSSKFPKFYAFWICYNKHMLVAQYLNQRALAK